MPAARKKPDHVPRAKLRRAGGLVSGCFGHEVDCEADTPKARELKKQASRRAGFRTAAWLIGLFCFVALVAAAWRETLYRNPRFGLKEVTVFTEGALKPEKLVREMGLVEGMDTLWLNLRSVSERAERLPQVKSATASRDYQGRMKVTVVQRTPVAWLECQRLGLYSMKSGFGCLLDEEGVAMPCDVILKEYTRLPTIRFEELSQVQQGVPVMDLQVKAALRLHLEMEKRLESGMGELVRIEVPVPYALVAHFDDEMEITFSPDSLDEQLERFDRLMIEAHQKGWKIATLNLIPRRNTPITFREAPRLVSVR
jgi:cell division septal protein FtsQ